MAYHNKKPAKPKYVYAVSQAEISFKTLMNPDKEEFAKIKGAITENGGFCVCKTERTPTNRCMCLEFQNKMSEGWCGCHLYKKVKRTADEAERYSKNIEFDDDKDYSRVKKAEAKEAKARKLAEEAAG